MLYVELVRTIKVNLRRTVYIQWYITIFAVFAAIYW